ncbi:hypothetical protein EF879_01560 [Micromonospora sp. HM5-17]|nr:hypothetical protein EF879_01560 [Micromonospora sp. HM5-17]
MPDGSGGNPQRRGQPEQNTRCAGPGPTRSPAPRRSSGRPPRAEGRRPADPARMARGGRPEPVPRPRTSSRRRTRTRGGPRPGVVASRGPLSRSRGARPVRILWVGPGEERPHRRLGREAPRGAYCVVSLSEERPCCREKSK